MPHKPTGIVAAMARELVPLLRGHRAKKIEGLECFEMEDAVVVIGGIGRGAARRAAETAVDRYSPWLLVSAGIAGGLKPELKVGDIVEAREVINAGSEERFAAIGSAGTVLSATSVSGPAEKRSLAAKWSADVVEMEAAAVAEVARVNGLAFGAVKAVSDELEFSMPPLGRFVSEAGQFETLRFAGYLAVHPNWWSVVRQLNANTKTASVKLSEALLHLIDQWSKTAAEGKTLRA